MGPMRENGMTELLVRAVQQYQDYDIVDESGLDQEEIGIFRLVVLGADNPSYNVYGLPEEHAGTFLIQVQESVHQSFDGWSPEEQVVIQAYLADVTSATWQVVRDRETG